MPAALRRRLEHVNPDLRPPIPEAAPDDSQHQRKFFENATEPDCTCRAFDGHGQNPECDAHPWWRTDPPVLHLADLTRELGSALEAARHLFGGSA
jgi:hypothetical protein